MTTLSKKYPTRIEVKYNSKKGWMVLDQIRTVDKQRIFKVLASLTEKEIEKVKNIIKELLVD
ncbi:type II toxin-antitoxin system PemK/MazF family toxin [Geofilum rhodophaeum]|uniref:type II toxin-antitoxin system PemK/MazF family toxin n=1 Tax=Geofilum rhodophaeum TaxID=1965019 RepID=UPI000B523108|nr:type II toxin-antitoxin system PemK/MazF family toxin [Geofilum rhodophaeum]